MRRNSLFVGLFLVLLNSIENTIGDAPNFVSAFGLTVQSSTLLNPQLYEVVVSSKEVLGNQAILIIVPTDYTTSGPSRRYPVLYLLHGAYNNAASWTTRGSAQNITGNASLITVMPNGDPFGFYTNWVNPENASQQNWRTYHMEQLVPWIDLNLRTVAKKEGRSIAGLSMGGYGAIHYAELYTDNFIYAASFSGVINLFDTRVQKIVINLPGPGKPLLLGPFGDPSAPVGSNGWFAEDTITRAAELRNISIALYTGNADGWESTFGDGSHRLQNLLLMLNIPVYLDDYGNGQSIGHGCNGKHNWDCFSASLIDVFPRIMAVLQQQY
jgi:S-formylglutathione hydrolase FrmB